MKLKEKYLHGHTVYNIYWQKRISFHHTAVRLYVNMSHSHQRGIPTLPWAGGLTQTDIAFFLSLLLSYMSFNIVSSKWESIFKMTLAA